MHFAPLIVSFAIAAGITGSVIDTLGRAGVVRENYRGCVLPAAAGVAVVGAALIALGPLAALDEFAGSHALQGQQISILVYVVGVAALGLIDDLMGGRRPAGAATSKEAPRGWRGHLAAILRGQVSTGQLKAAGALGLALFVFADRGLRADEYLVSVALLLLATNLFNLLDLRPGRAIKAFAALGLAAGVLSWNSYPLEVLGLFIGPLLVVGVYDIRERAMLGDAGSNLVGALAGFWLILVLDPTGELAALIVLVLITLYGEFRSINAVVERNPLLRRLDSIGRLRMRSHSRHGRSDGQAQVGTDG